jgi:hypothetical protein
MVCSYDIDRKCERVGFCSSSLNPKKTMESTNKRETPKDKISFFIISLEAICRLNKTYLCGKMF